MCLLIIFLSKGARQLMNDDNYGLTVCLHGIVCQTHGAQVRSGRGTSKLKIIQNKIFLFILSYFSFTCRENILIICEVLLITPSVCWIPGGLKIPCPTNTVFKNFLWVCIQWWMHFTYAKKETTYLLFILLFNLTFPSVTQTA